VTEAIEYEQFDQAGQSSGASSADADLSRLSDIPMELSVEIGRTHMTVGETLDLRVGSVVTLERLAGETADLLVNGSAIARGEVVVIDEQYGLRVTEILDRQQEAELPASAGTSAPDAAPAAEPASDGVPAGAATQDGVPAAGAAPAATGDGPESAAAATGEG
jgi:flagellar motor switch protein FliN